jgi:hypothetical protein
VNGVGLILTSHKRPTESLEKRQSTRAGNDYSAAVQSKGLCWRFEYGTSILPFAVGLPAFDTSAYIRFSGWSMDKNCQTVHHLFLPQLLPNSLVFPGTLNQSIRAANRTLAMVPTSLVESF